MTPSPRPRVVVVGAGFGGLWAARALRDEPVEVLILDRDNYHTFLPLLYQVAASELGPGEIAYPVRSIFRGTDNVRFRMAEVVDVDRDRKRVRTARGEIDYDYLIVATGSTPAFFGVDGAEEHAFPLRTMDQAIPLRHRILTRFETAAYEESPEARRRLLTFVIVGGGPTGVEFAGALAELVYGPLRKDYPSVDVDEVRIVLLEALDRLLQGMPEKLGRYARDRLERRGVEVRTAAEVEAVERDRVCLADGDVLSTDTVVWTAGVRGDPAAEEWGFPAAVGGRVRVDETLRVPGSADLFVVGDLALVEDERGQPLPQVAPVATQEAERAAGNVLRLVEGREPEPFAFEDPGMLAVVGRNAAVAHVWGRAFTGFVAWILWLAVHIVELIGFRNRVLVLVNWAWNYVFYEHAVRLVVPLPDDGPNGRRTGEEAEAGPARERGSPETRAPDRSS